MLRRVLAVMVAVGLVAGAFAVRSSRDGGGGGGRDDGEAARLVCAAELAGLCQAAGVDHDVEPAATTAARLSALPDNQLDGVGAWLTLQPWPQIVADRRERAGLEPVFGGVDPIARSPLGVALLPDRRQALATVCAEMTWRCLGEQAPRRWADIGGRPEWGPVDIGHAAPDEAAGLLVLGALTAGWFGRTDVIAIDLEDDEFRSWFTGVEGATRFSATALDELLVSAATHDLVITLEALAAAPIAASARSPKPVLIYPAPMTTAVLELARPAQAGDGAGESEDRLREQALTSGWRAAGDGATGLPSPGLLDALITMWQEVI